jgi:hypothetical protein
MSTIPKRKIEEGNMAKLQRALVLLHEGEEMVKVCEEKNESAAILVQSVYASMMTEEAKNRLKKKKTTFENKDGKDMKEKETVKNMKKKDSMEKGSYEQAIETEDDEGVAKEKEKEEDAGVAKEKEKENVSGNDSPM